MSLKPDEFVVAQDKLSNPMCKPFIQTHTGPKLKYMLLLASLSAAMNTFANEDAADESAEIEQITVTATKQQSSLKTLTGNLASIEASSIQNINAQHINQTMQRVAGTWISRGNGQEHLTAIRSPVLTGAGGCGAFFIAQDGISARAPGFCNANQLFDLNSEQAGRIEVIRGPASVLYGSNAVHGVLNVLTHDAFNAPSPYLGMTLGPNDYYKADFSFGGSDSEQALLAYGNFTEDGGYKDDSGFSQQKLNVIHQFQKDKLRIKSVFAFTNLNQETSGFVQGFEAFQDPDLKRVNPNPEAFRDSKTARLYSQIDYQIDDMTTFTVTPYLRSTEMTFLQHFLPWQSLEENEQQSVGLQSRYIRQFDEITLLSGFDLDYTQGALRETQARPFSATIPAGDHYDYEVDATVLSPYANVLWQPSDALTVNTGVRFEHTEYDYDNLLTDGDACAEGVTNCRFTRPEDQTRTFNEWSYQTGLNYSVSEQHNFYANYSKGYRAPQATELFRLQAGQSIADLDAEKIDSIEVGLRGQVSDLFYDITAFWMDKDNFIFQDTQRQNISNGKTQHTGVEVAAKYSLPEGWYIAANATFANHEYANDITLSRESIKGNEIDTAPEHMGSAQLGWRSDAGTDVEVEWVHLGNYFLNPENTAEYGGHNLLNVRASHELSNAFSLSLHLINLTDEDYAERADFGFGNYRYFVGEPRSVFVSVRFNL